MCMVAQRREALSLLFSHKENIISLSIECKMYEAEEKCK